MEKKFVIAVDGPAASGKSTTAKWLAKKLGYLYIDTGAMYRACGLYSLKKKVSLSDLEALKRMLETIDIKIDYSSSGNKILLNGEDVTDKIREEDISKISSDLDAL